MTKKVESYFAHHSRYNSVIHTIGGIGLGILLARPLVGEHPMRWGILLLVIAVLGHIYPMMAKK